ncbi:hypothetical protein [Biostraticola tofi]|uniref:Uncharacterized protein n=1 Tax=Biostraticola tofi TaxID=466109 RepID=A0A4R3YNA8_9GAMM|nr:hypothetical protein [Biostraticola tofi]TCV93008.1 hypothetical protein EDC52_11040 [Biostraticola tofi]
MLLPEPQSGHPVQSLKRPEMNMEEGLQNNGMDNAILNLLSVLGSSDLYANFLLRLKTLDKQLNISFILGFILRMH